MKKSLAILGTLLCCTLVHAQEPVVDTLSASRVTETSDVGIRATRMGAMEIPTVALRKTPLLFGEPDPLKVLQLLPGVQGGGEGTSGLYVRGGGPDENLLLLDGIPIYNAEHMLGLFSIFQTEAIRNVTLYKGGFPARFGGRISSIIDVSTADGSFQDYHATIGVAALSDKFHVDGPIWKGHTSFSANLRGMHTFLFDRLINLLGSPANYYFFDASGGITHKFSDRDVLRVGAYYGHDELYYKDSEEDESSYSQQKMSILWGNTVASLRWHHIFENGITSDLTLAYNRYRLTTKADVKSVIYGETSSTASTNIDYRSGMRDWVAKADFRYHPFAGHEFRFGGGYTHHTFLPETFAGIRLETENGVPLIDQKIALPEAVPLRGHDFILYGEDEISIGRHLRIDPGVSLSIFSTGGRTWLSPEPRLSARYEFGLGWAAKASYTRMSQYVHLLSSSQVTLPTDLWVPITSEIPPETANQYSLGGYWSGLKGWEFSLEAYYKDMNNVLEYKDGESFIGGSASWEDKVVTGLGRAYGVELFAEKTTGRLTGWLGYTLAWSERRFPDGSISGGEWFPYRYDRRHNINLVANYAITPKIDISGTWSFATGGTTTLPERQAVTVDPYGNVSQTDYISHRNNYRLPPTHMLNVGINFHKRYRRSEGIWNISIYNVYNQMNPNFVFRYSDREPPGADDRVTSLDIDLTKITILPIIPSFGYTWTF